MKRMFFFLHHDDTFKSYKQLCGSCRGYAQIEGKQIDMKDNCIVLPVQVLVELVLGLDVFA